MSSQSLESAGSRRRAVLVGLQLPGMTEAEVTASLDELARLCRTLGLSPVERITQARPDASGSTVVGAGKLRELARLTGGTGIVPSGASRRQTGTKPAEPEPAGDGESLPEVPDEERVGTVVVDHDLAPSQLRHLEDATGAQVLDRSSVILAIFQRHARTREARIQVEIARLSYMAPRLRATGGGDRGQGGVGGRGGAGESSLELDRRRVRDRIAELKQELELVQREARTRRERRVHADTVALVGYTNAGKSSLMRALTGSDVLVADQLFATLDTTVRQLHPPARPPVLVSDTVGFIKRLPHDLVASFRSTLEEAREAALLLHVVDASDPAWRSQLEVTRKVLDEIGASDRPSLLVLNKADRLDAAAREELESAWPEALVLSALRPQDVARLHARILGSFEASMVDGELLVPYRDARLVHEIHESCRVVSEAHGEAGTKLRVRAPQEVLDRLRARLSEASSAAV